MASYEPVIKNGASGAIFYAGLLDAVIPGALKASPTLAAGDFQISKDGGAFANLGTLPTVTPAAGRAVKFTLSQAETNADNIVIQCVDQTSPKEWVDAFILIQTAAKQFDDLATATALAAVAAITDLLVNITKTAQTIGRGTATTGGSTTSIPTSAFLPAGAIVNQFVGRVVLFDWNTTTTTLRGVAKSITASSNAANPTFTVDPLPAAPASGDVFSVI